MKTSLKPKGSLNKASLTKKKVKGSEAINNITSKPSLFVLECNRESSFEINSDDNANNKNNRSKSKNVIDNIALEREVNMSFSFHCDHHQHQNSNSESKDKDNEDSVIKQIEKDLSNNKNNKEEGVKDDKANISSIRQRLSNSLLHINNGFITNTVKKIKLSSSIPNLKMIQLKKDLNLKVLYSSTNTPKLHLIKELRNDELALKNKIAVMINNKNKLENEGRMSLDTNSIEDSLKKIKAKDIKKQIELLSNRLNYINCKRELLIEEEEDNAGITGEKIKANMIQFQQNVLSPDSNRINKLRRESALRQKRRLIDVNEKHALKASYLDSKEKKKEQKRIDKLAQMKLEERELITKRKQQNNERLSKLKPINDNKNIIKPYSHIDLSKQYVLSEKLRFQKEKLQRKEIMKPKEEDDLKAFCHNYDLDKQRLSKELSMKRSNLIQLWNERSQLLPNPNNQEQSLLLDETLLKMAVDEEKKDILQRNIIQKQQYGIKVRQPKPNLSLKSKRLGKITSINIKDSLLNKRYDQSNNSLSCLEMNRDYSNPNYNHQEGRAKSNPTNGKVEQEKQFVKVNQKKRIKPLELSEEQKRRSKPSDWNSIILKEKELSSLKNGMIMVKNRISTLDDKIKRHSKLLRFNKDSENHLDLEEEVNHLLVESIKAKISILDNLFPQDK